MGKKMAPSFYIFERTEIQFKDFGLGTQSANNLNFTLEY